VTHRKGFETLHRETDADALERTGEIPAWLEGILLRIGPAQFEVGDDAYRHWFDGHAMIHAFRFRDGKVGYGNRFLESDSRTRCLAKGRIARGEFGTDPCRSIFRRAMQLFAGTDGTDNANVNVARLADRFVAMTETPMPIVFDAGTLETRGRFEYRDDLEGDLTTAHPLRDPWRGEVYNYLTELGRPSTCRVYRQAEGSPTRRILAELDVHPPRYMHSFGMTRHHIVLVEFPLVFRPLTWLLSGKPVAETLSWEPKRGTRFRIVDKHSGEVTGTATAEAFFAFHHVNAWEEEGEIVLDMIAYPDARVVEELYLDRLRSDAPAPAAGRLRRWRLRADGSGLRGRQVADAGLELPQIHEAAHRARPYRFIWGVGQGDGAPFPDEIVRIDTETGRARRWREPGCHPGEPVFVPRPEAEAENDGVLLSVVLDGRAERSFLLVLDAASLEEIGRATVSHHIPFGFHGSFFPGAG